MFIVSHSTFSYFRICLTTHGFFPIPTLTTTTATTTMASREPTPSSNGDTIEERHDLESSRLAPADIDDTASASDLPARTATPSSTKGTKRPRSSVKRPRPKKGTTVFVNEGVDGTEDEATPVRSKKSGSAEPEIKTTGNAVGTRKTANGTVGSVYSGSKVRHIKKPDGVPLWRKEIQYAFLHEVVHDETRCFTRLSDGQKNCTFADIYVDSMARSSKTSKVLKDRLSVDRPAALNMAMICLLVNVGRMNTTLNFFPEMRAQLRTYHPIPSLQAYPTQKDYKSLQDAPRLKSILKGATEDEEQPRDLPHLRAASIPRCNPVNCIFVLSQHANEVSQSHFVDKIDFFDLAMRSTITSHSRAQAFLWLMWYYLESDFTKEAALNNPFGPGEYRDGEDPNNPNTIPLLVPHFEHITEEEGDAENVDPQEEIEFGEKMTKERERLNAKFAEEEALNEANGGKEITHKGVKRLKRTAKELGDDLDSSDVDSRASPMPSTRSPAPTDTPGHLSASMLQADSLEDELEPMDSHPGRGRYKRVRGKNTPSRSKIRASDIGATGSVRGAGRSRLGLASDRGTPDTTRGTPQPMPPGGIHHPVLSQYPHPRQPMFEQPVLNGNAVSTSKSRARTGYQRELEEHKQRRVDWLVNKRRKATLKEQRKKREGSEPSWLVREMYRISQLDATYDSEEDDSASFGISLLQGLRPNIPHRGTGLGGILPNKKSGPLPSLNAENSTDSAPLKKDNGEGGPLLAASATAIDGLEDDYGEEAESWKRVFERTSRRLYTWSGDKDVQAFLDNKRREQQRHAVPYPANRVSVYGQPVSGGHDDMPGQLASSITSDTPRKPKHEIRKSLNAEIDEDLLRSNDDSDADMEDEDGDVTMAGPAAAGLGRSVAVGAVSDTDMG